MKLLRARDLMGLPVVSIASGEDVAEVRDVVYDGEAHHLVGFTLNKRGFFSGRLKSVLGADVVAAVGPDAVMIEDESVIDDSSNDPAALRDPGSARRVLGNRVLSADGSELGEVIAVIVSTPQPRAVGYEVRSPDRSDTSFVPISAQMSLSGENLVLPTEATEFVRNDLAGFGAAIASYRSPEMEQDR